MMGETSGRNSKWIWALNSVLLVSIAQLLMKWGMMQLAIHWPAFEPCRPSECDWQAASLIATPVLIVCAGLSCYVLSMASWIKALKQLPLSVAYPVLSLSYVLVYIGAVWLPWLNEPFHWLKSAGIFFILIGLVLIYPQEKVRL